MQQLKQVVAIVGSASRQSSNKKLIELIGMQAEGLFDLHLVDDLKALPPFDPELSLENAPDQIVRFRQLIDTADGVLICTPEYVFSIPSCLKNCIEWCVATTVFSDKPAGLITASADGRKGHDELQLLMKTLMARFIPQTTWLIQGIKGKIGIDGSISDPRLQDQLTGFIRAYHQLLHTVLD